MTENSISLFICVLFKDVLWSLTCKRVWRRISDPDFMWKEQFKTVGCEVELDVSVGVKHVKVSVMDSLERDLNLDLPASIVPAVVRHSDRHEMFLEERHDF